MKNSNERIKFNRQLSSTSGMDSFVIPGTVAHIYYLKLKICVDFIRLIIEHRLRRGSRKREFGTFASNSSFVIGRRYSLWKSWYWELFRLQQSNYWRAAKATQIHWGRYQCIQNCNRGIRSGWRGNVSYNYKVDYELLGWYRWRWPCRRARNVARRGKEPFKKARYGRKGIFSNAKRNKRTQNRSPTVKQRGNTSGTRICNSQGTDIYLFIMYSNLQAELANLEEEQKSYDNEFKSMDSHLRKLKHLDPLAAAFHISKRKEYGVINGLR